MFTRQRLASLALLLALGLVLMWAAGIPAVQAATETKVTFVHFSDYHSHAVPFYSEGKANQAGLARAIGYLKQAKSTMPNPILLSGGDMMNAGSPSWSDKYQCAEWPMLNGLVDAMAIGNHDVDYGWDAFLKCRAGAQYPLLSANLIFTATNKPVLDVGGKPYIVKQVGDVKIGLFAIAGPDYPRLVARKNLTDTVGFGDPIAAAKTIVAALKNDEKVNAVVLFGHEEHDADVDLAKAVPGIDLILGTHSHLKSDLAKIEGTNTYTLSPFQYLTYLSQVEMTFTDGKLTAVTGKLVKMDENVKPDAATEQKITQMQQDLEKDPTYAPKFVKIGDAGVEFSVEGVDKSESVLGNYVMDTLRQAVKAHAAFSTASSFRASIPPGPIRMEDYLTALPYKNIVMVYDLTGAQLKAVLDVSVTKAGSGDFSATSGLRYQLTGGKVGDVLVLKDPGNPAAGFEALDAAKTYQVMTTDYQGKVSGIYKDLFAKASNLKDTGLIINDVVIDTIKKTSPISAKVDGRVSSGPLLPATGAAADPAGALAASAAGATLLATGWLLRRRLNAL